MTDNQLNENLLFAVGFTRITCKDKIVKLWTKPGDKHYSIVELSDDPGSLPSFTTDFNACLKWIMPVLRERGLLAFEIYYETATAMAILFANGHTIQSQAETETLAFCRAAWEFLKER